jgi:Concanavalin A-like lectin/glucanases superfamily/SprB repeat/Secretion system C-terminal sorting domain
MYRFILLLVIALLTQFTMQAQVPSYVPTNNLEGWWPFNGNATDESGNGNHGNPSSVYFTTDRFGNPNKCYGFDGTSSRIVTTNIPSLSGHYSISAWFNPESLSSWGTIIDCRKSVNSGIGLEHNTKVSFTTSKGTTYSLLYANHTIQLNNWIHVVSVYNGTQKLIYINGVLSVTEPYSSLLLSTTEPFVIGDRGVTPSGPGNYFKGKLDDIGIWNRALTQLEITALYQAVVPVTASASTISNVTCFNGINGSATVTPNGGTPPYTYSWNTSPVQTTQTATGLRAGVYTVTVTDSKGSLTTANATVTQPNAITNVIASTLTNVGCFGGNNGSVTVTNPSGGTPPYTYLWNTSPPQVTQTASNLIAGTYIVTVTDSKGCIATSTASVTQPAQALSNVIGQTVQNVKCNGTATGIITVSNPVGGTPPYSYKWNTIPIQNTQLATNVPAGVYSVTVTDNNGCIATAFTTVTEPTKITNVQASVVKSVECYGESNGSARVSDPRGGTAPYTYQWNTTPVQNTQIASNLKAGEYIVTIADANGCQAQSFVTITQPNAPLSTVSAKVEKQISCFGENDGSVSIPIPTGGTPPYNVIWNGNSSLNTYVLIGLKPGLYTAVIKDVNGCTVSSQATIIEPAQVVVSSPKDTTVLIQTKAELVASTNQTASKYQWQSNTGTGYQNLENVFQYSGVKTSKLTIDNITLANHNQPFRCIIETNGCYDTTAIAILTVRTNVGIDEQGDSPSLLVYPNPTGESDELLIQLGNIESQLLNIELLDMMGISRVQTEIQSQNGIFPIAVSDIAKGMYIVRVTTSSGVLTQKIIVN